MLSIKLSRFGKRNRAFYRIIVQEKRKDPYADYLEALGYYNPLTEPATIKLKEERIKYWLSQGAQPTPVVHNILVEKGILKAQKMRLVKTRKKEEKEQKEETKESKKEEEIKEEKKGL